MRLPEWIHQWGLKRRSASPGIRTNSRSCQVSVGCWSLYLNSWHVRVSCAKSRCYDSERNSKPTENPAVSPLPRHKGLENRGSLRTCVFCLFCFKVHSSSECDPNITTMNTPFDVQVRAFGCLAEFHNGFSHLFFGK